MEQNLDGNGKRMRYDTGKTLFRRQLVITISHQPRCPKNYCSLIEHPQRILAYGWFDSAFTTVPVDLSYIEAHENSNNG
jgi:hypothetical protein